MEYVGYKDPIGDGLFNMGLTDTEVIRCRDCKYLTKYGDCSNEIWSVAYGEGYPTVVPDIGMDDGFCAWAERREP